MAEGKCPIGISCADIMLSSGLTAEDCTNLETCIAEACYRLNMTPEDRKCLEEAVTSSYNKALESESDDWRVWNKLGNALRKLGRLEEAVAAYERSTKLKPNNFSAWRWRGIALEKLGRLEEAVVSYERCLKLLKWKDPQICIKRGKLLQRLGRDISFPPSIF